MAEMFKINSSETKLIARDTHIYADTLTIPTEVKYQINNPTSKAYRQKIKFWISGVEYTDPANNMPIKFRIGKYVELEHGANAIFVNTTIPTLDEQGFAINYLCGENNNGVFDVTIKIAPTLSISNKIYQAFLSAVCFEDSFFDADKTWENPTYPNYINDWSDTPIDGQQQIGGTTGFFDPYSWTPNTVVTISPNYYGYRKDGTFTVVANSMASGSTGYLAGYQGIKLIHYGGWFGVVDGIGTISSAQWGTTMFDTTATSLLVQFSSGVVVQDNGLSGSSVGYYSLSSYPRTNQPYQFWFTFTM